MTRIAVVAGIAFSLAALLAYVPIHDSQYFSSAKPAVRGGVELDSGTLRDTELASNSAVHEALADWSNPTIGPNAIYDEEFLALIRVSEGLANPASEIRYMYIWRKEGTGPEWEAYLPVIPDGVKAMIADGLDRQQRAE